MPVTATRSKSGVKLKFFDSHQPALEDGEYELSVTQKIFTDSFTDSFPGAVATFHVAGPRFSIDPQQIDSVFPPDGSLGDHRNVLPHVALKRGTLPWERRAVAGDNTLPWVALLVFDYADGIDEPKDPVTLASLTPAIHSLEPDQSPIDLVRVIHVPWDLLTAIFPSNADLRHLAHVRQRREYDDQGGLIEGAEVAVVLANRLPTGGSSSVAHLVSLEQRITSAGLDPAARNPDGTVTFVSLMSWRFSCTSHEHSFVGLLTGLNRNPPATGGKIDTTFRIPATAQPDPGPHLAAGAAPLGATLRTGQKTVSWYHGPFFNGLTGIDVASGARHGDAHLLYDATSGLFDVAYAAAWELGRWLTVRSTRVSTELFLWKRRQAQTLITAGQNLFHLPAAERTTRSIADLPPAVSDWFDGLRLLKNIPFPYLVPRADMLPPESIRFFRIDPHWLDALIDGAFSIGRISQAQAEPDASTLTETRPERATMSGILLRSAAVSYWPGMQCRGWNTSSDDVDNDPATIEPLTLLRREVLAPGVLLCLFKNDDPNALQSDGSVVAVDFFLRPEAMHHGFLPDGSVAKYRRRVDGSEDDPPQTVTGLFRDNVHRCVQIDDFAQKLVGASASSGSFGFAMIEGSDRVRIRKS